LSVAGKAVHALLSLVVWLLILVLIALSIRQVIVFSAQLASQDWAKAFRMLADNLVIPFNQPDVRSPYGGKFDVDNALSVALVLVAEWGMSRVRDAA
jgi:UDP-N-acetylmuramyl tripeptide synthase